MDTERIATTAERLAGRFTTAKRDNGETYLRYDHDGPDADLLGRIVEAGHGNMFPDDHRYQMICDALEALGRNDGDIDEARDDLEAPMYTADLLRWASSNFTRLGYADEALADGLADNVATALGWGYTLEARETLEAVYAALADEDDDDE